MPTGTGHAPTLQEKAKGAWDSAAESVAQHQQEAAGSIGDFQGRSTEAFDSAQKKVSAWQSADTMSISNQTDFCRARSRILKKR